MAHVPFGRWCFDKIRLFWPAIVVVWFCVQCLLWSLLERHHHGFDSPSSQRVRVAHAVTANNPAPPVVIGQPSKREVASDPKLPNLYGTAAAAGNHPTPRPIHHNDTFHIVFSTDCSGYQHWQGILLYYSARRVHQPGSITRIASGCTDEQERSIRDEWRRIDPAGDRFRVHFAPSTVLNPNGRREGTYKYSNKPGGILHWLRHDGRLHEGTVVCLLDPDMILLRPITADLLVSQERWSVRPRGKNQIEYVDGRGIPRLLRLGSLQKSETDPLPNRVATGFPAGQHFGVGGAWVRGSAPHAGPAWRNFSKAAVCTEGSPCTTTSESDAAHRYAVGPVYLATVADWKRIPATWWDFVPRVYAQYPYLLAEMYAFTMAVADLELPFRLLSSYMVTGSGVSSPTEAWSWIDDHPQTQGGRPHADPRTNRSVAERICSGVDATTPPDWTRDPRSLALPNTLHYCQRYVLDPARAGDGGPFLFAKRRIPHDVFSCEGERGRPVPFDARRLVADASERDDWSTVDRRSLFALCHLVPILNWARSVYWEEVCE